MKSCKGGNEAMSAAENISLYKLPDVAIANLSKPAQVWNVIFLAERSRHRGGRRGCGCQRRRSLRHGAEEVCNDGDANKSGYDAHHLGDFIYIE
jgi:hypothetical protein